MRALTLLVALAFVGCASSFRSAEPAYWPDPAAEPPNRSEFARADYGAQITSAVAIPQIRMWMERTLKDPESARYTFVGAKRVCWRSRQEPRVFGWGFLFGCNARNSYGGYTGEQNYVALFRDDVMRGLGPSADIRVDFAPRD